MALPEININDFQGVLRLSRDMFEVEQLQNYIDTFYPQAIEDLIGIEAKEIIESQTNLDTKWSDLMLGTTYFNNTYDNKERIKGLRWIAIQFIYFQFTRDYLLHSNTGFVTNKNENSYDSLYSNSNILAQSQYNKGISEFNRATIDYLINYMPTYQDITSFIWDAIESKWTINTDCTKYLLGTDKVVIDSVEYPIFNLITDTSFQIEADEFTFNISRLKYSYKPFDKVIFCHQRYSSF